MKKGMGIIIAAIAVIILLAFIGKFFSLWLQALFSRANVSIFQLIGMRLRKVPPQVIVEARILSCKAGLPVDTNLLEAHYLSRGNVLRVIQALIAANKANAVRYVNHARDARTGDLIEAISPSGD